MSKGPPKTGRYGGIPTRPPAAQPTASKYLRLPREPEIGSPAWLDSVNDTLNKAGKRPKDEPSH